MTWLRYADGPMSDQSGEGNSSGNEGGAPSSAPSVRPRSSIPPKHAALARKLTGGQSIPPTSRVSTGPNKVVSPSMRPEAAPGAASSPDVASERERIYAARRDSLMAKAADSVDEPRRKSQAPKPAGQPRWVKGVAVVAVLVGLGFGGVHLRRTLDDRSDGGRVRNGLVAWELGPRDPAAREAAFAQIDQLGPSAMTAVVDLLVDDHVAEKSGSRSTRRLQEIANTYLLRRAAMAKADPPPQSKQVERQIAEGSYPPAASWAALRDAWRKWLDDARARGLVPKA